MPEKKRQHYVPQFYLRHFSTDDEKRQISLFNINSQRLIPNASIKRQACQDNFYGSDKIIESALEPLENASAKVIQRIISKNDHPRYNSEEHLIILLFVTNLRLRTLYIIETLKEMKDRSYQKLFSINPNIKPFLKKDKSRIDNFSQYAMQLAIQRLPTIFLFMMDLDYKLLINETQTPFITSDNPVVFYNQFFEGRKTPASNTGFASKGLQIFLPLSPKHQIVFFDQDIYKVYGITNNPVVLKNKNDIESINALQFLNSHSNLYFNSQIFEDTIKSLVSKYSSFRRTTKSSVEKYYNKHNEKRNQQFLILTSMQDINCRLSLSFITLTKEAKKFKDNNRAVLFRNEELYNHYKDFKDK